MEAALKYAVDAEWSYTVVALCESIGIARTTYYDWFRDNADFVRWWRNHWAGYFGQTLPRVWGAMVKKAEGLGEDKASPQAAKLFVERFDGGYQPKTRQELSGETTLKTYINVDVPRVAGQEVEAEEDIAQAGSLDSG